MVVCGTHVAIVCDAGRHCNSVLEGMYVENISKPKSLFMGQPPRRQPLFDSCHLIPVLATLLHGTLHEDDCISQW